MNTKQFLELVVPDGQLLGLTRQWVINGEKAMSNHPVRSHEDLAAGVLGLDKKGVDVWYALASFVEDAKHMKDGKKLRLHRTVKMVDRLQAIWLDIDFKDCPAKELVPKLSQFIKDTGLPNPSMIVNSGGGLHIYWCLSEPQVPSDWVLLAEGLKTLCKTHNLPADHVCTSDQARVLRPPGTHNHKYDPPRPVKVVAGDGARYAYDDLLTAMPKVDLNQLPAHLRGVKVEKGEYSATGSTRREVDTGKVVKGCNILRHVLKTGGKEQSEPEWNATMLLLRFLPEGGKLVHPMSKGHIDYTPDATMEKWQQKLNADVSGPPFCSTFQQYYDPAKICAGCPIYQSKQGKTPLALGYVSDEEKQAQQPQTPKGSPGAFVTTPVHDFPDNWRAIPGNLGVERKAFNPKEGEWEWVKVLRRTWRLKQAQKSANSNEFTYVVEAKTVTGKSITIEVQGADLWGSTRTWETLSARGAPLTTDEQKHWKDLMATWLQKLQEENAVLDTTEQLGWIERVNDNDDKLIVGFASGSKAFFADGGMKQSVVTANHKHKGIADYYRPVGKVQKWKDIADFLVQQGHNHIITALASSFAGPLIKFTGQSGAIMSIVSTGSGMGKSLSLETAGSVWGNPKLGGITLNDTPTTVKNKLAYLQNITAYWDEVRGDDRGLQDFIQTAFQVTQGKDRERADRQARTIQAQTWHTLLVCMSNDSIFDLAAGETKASDAGVYRVFEVYVNEDEKPIHDPAIQSLVSELQGNYGGVGELYAEYLAKHTPQIRKRVEHWRLKLEAHFGSSAAERFWIATMTSLVVGAELAKKAGIVDFDIPKLVQYLSHKYKQLRVRVTSSRSLTDPKELLVSYMMQHQHERLVVDKIKIGRGGRYEPQIMGNPANIRKVTYQIGKEQNILRVVKSDFARWLFKTRQLRLSGNLLARFVAECNMRETKSVLGLATQFATSRAACLDFDIEADEIEELPQELIDE